jgi:hypothetical protein
VLACTARGLQSATASWKLSCIGNNESGCEGQGVSSSDINHTAYSLVKTGDIEYIFDSELPVYRRHKWS